jgi:hypothetical protein
LHAVSQKASRGGNEIALSQRLRLCGLVAYRIWQCRAPDFSPGNSLRVSIGLDGILVAVRFVLVVVTDGWDHKALLSSRDNVSHSVRPGRISNGARIGTGARGVVDAVTLLAHTTDVAIEPIAVGRTLPPCASFGTFDPRAAVTAPLPYARLGAIDTDARLGTLEPLALFAAVGSIAGNSRLMPSCVEAAVGTNTASTAPEATATCIAQAPTYHARRVSSK